MSLKQITEQIGFIEKTMSEFHRKAHAEIADNGKASLETKNILDKFGEQQRELAERLLSVEQNGTVASGGGFGSSVTSMGGQFTSSTAYGNFRQGDANKARFEVQNNIVKGGDITVAPDRSPGVVSGAFAPLTLESFLPALPTVSNSVEYTRELAFNNSAAETAESTAKPESSITFELQSMHISTVAHWVRISRQLAEDAPALSAYINARMAYGVDKKVDFQLATGNGVSPNISGLFDVGNFTTHAYTAAVLGATMPKLVLIRKLISDLWVLGYPADAIILNPADWTDIQLELLLAPTNAMRVDIHADGQPMLWGVPVIQAAGMAVDTILVGAFAQAATIHNRQGVMVELSESDGDNFTKNLITVRAERRLALTVDRPLAILGGDLTPA